jgi:hypothetical protein
LRAQFPTARSLEEAYFAATHGPSAETNVAAAMDSPPITIPIEAFQAGVQR